MLPRGRAFRPGPVPNFTAGETGENMTVAATVEGLRSYKAGFYGGGTGNTKDNPAYNSLRFATREEAETYAKDLFMRWTQPSAWMVCGSADPVNR